MIFFFIFLPKLACCNLLTETKSISTLFVIGMAALVVTSASLLLSNNALAYTKNDTAVKFSCFQHEGVSHDFPPTQLNGNKSLPLLVDKDGNLTPCVINEGDNAWMMTASALVLIMTPGGLAIFYSGLSRQKNAVNTLHMVFITTGIIGIQWVFWGYSLAFGPDATGNGFIGTLDWVGLNNVLHDVPSDVYGGLAGPTIPHQTYMVFQMMFAIITPALIVAALAERMKWSAFVIFIILWATFVYDFAAHWTWSLGSGGTHVGWTGALPSLDFAGGTVIHITSGWSGLVIALMLGRRLGYGKIPMEPHNISLVVLGAALLWFGWFGFNAGSAAWAGTNATSAFVATQIATAMADCHLDANFMGSYGQTFHSRCCLRCCRRTSCYHTCVGICWPNGCDHHRHMCFPRLLWSSYV